MDAIVRRYGDLAEFVEKGKVTVIYGARRTGKTTLALGYLARIKQNDPGIRILSTTGEDRKISENLSSKDQSRISALAEDYDVIFIDEAQEIEDAGMGLKMLIDSSPDKSVIVSGSSSFDLTYKLGDPLVGRKTEIVLYPISIGEMISQFGAFQAQSEMNDYLVFGMYPQVRTAGGGDEKIRILSGLVDSYIFKDVLQFGAVRNSTAVKRLLTALAYQIGNSVSVNELSILLKIDAKTVQRYLDLLEECFIIQSLGGFSRNLRKELKQKKKYYFCDVGIRNALIGDFNSPDVRGDIGGLWENFVIIERIKQQKYGSKFYANNYFWRNSMQQEIDLIEDYDGALHATEIKWSGDAKAKLPSEFADGYPNALFQIANSRNFFEWINHE